MWFVLQASAFGTNYLSVLKVEASDSPPPLTLEELSNQVADEYGVPRATLWNLVMSESVGGKYREGDGGMSCGVIHIHKDYFPEEHKRCNDDRFVLSFAAKKIAEGKEHLFTPCSCIQFAKALGVKVPKHTNAWDLEPNITPQVGKLILFRYKNGSSHVGVITKLNDGFVEYRDANGPHAPCKTATRTTKWNNPDIYGFWSD